MPTITCPVSPTARIAAVRVAQNHAVGANSDHRCGIDEGNVVQVHPKGRAHRLTIKLPQGFEPKNNNAPVDVVVKTTLDRPDITIPIRFTRRTTAQIAKTAKAQPAVTATALVGKAAPTISVTSLSIKKPVTINPASGKVIVLNFWSSWSRLSRAQLSAIQSLAGQYARKGVIFMHVNGDRLTPASRIPC